LNIFFFFASHSGAAGVWGALALPLGSS